jgi:predicted Fe-Mo cluster-binding NifX family protein
LDAAVDPRFGRCRYFVVVDSEQGTFEALENTNADRRGRAGVQSANTIASKGAKVLLTGKCGQNATRALAAAGIRVVPGCSGTVRAAIEKFKAGELQPVGDPKAAPRFRAGGKKRGR